MKLLRNILLWVLALVLTLSMAIYQRKTGPTYPMEGTVLVDATSVDWELKRSHGGDDDHEVRVTAPDSSISGSLHWKRRGVDEPFNEVVMAREGDDLVAYLPHQPPAGKLEYGVTLMSGENHVTLPSDEETAVIRFKGSVPTGVLVPHVLAMFIALLLSTRAALAGLVGERVRVIAWITLGCLVVGGLFLGPVVQKYAFGAYWTGWPFGDDLTDNKTLLAVIAWLIAVLRLRGPGGEARGRWWAFGAALVMLAVYSIPHSVRGSTYDYAQGEIVTGAQPATTTLSTDQDTLHIDGNDSGGQ